MKKNECKTLEQIERNTERTYLVGMLAISLWLQSKIAPDDTEGKKIGKLAIGLSALTLVLACIQNTVCAVQEFFEED